MIPNFVSNSCDTFWVWVIESLEAFFPHPNPAAFLKAAFIRLCHPAPPALNASTTSGSSRIVVETFRTSALGRPRFTGAASIFAAQSSPEKSGKSSSTSDKTGPVSFSLALICFPQTDYPPRVTSWRPRDKHKPPFHQPHGDKSRLAIVAPIIFEGQVRSIPDFTRMRHIKATPRQCLRTFRRIEVN